MWFTSPADAPGIRRVKRPGSCVRRYSQIPHISSAKSGFLSAILRIPGAIHRDLLFVQIADRQRHRFGIHQVPAFPAVLFANASFHNRVDRARFLAEAAEDALREINVVARRAARAVVALLGFDRDRKCRTYRFAQRPGDTAFLAVRISPQRMQTLESWRLWCLFLRISHSDLVREKVPAGQHHALYQLEQQVDMDELL